MSEGSRASERGEEENKKKNVKKKNEKKEIYVRFNGLHDAAYAHATLHTHTGKRER